MLEEIIKELKVPAGNRTTVAKAEVHKWMRSGDTDTLGATYGFLSNLACVQRVTPPLSFDEVFE